MKCSEARELFCARMDEELPLDRLSTMDSHLAACHGCRSAWVKYRTTVGLLHRLPEETTQPAFVGQVLDRIRAHEAEGNRVLAPLDSAGASARPNWLESLRDWMGQWVLRPVPAMAFGSLVIGVALGSWANHLSTSGGTMESMADVAPAPAVEAVPATMLQPSLGDRPFQDLADEIATKALDPRQESQAPFYSPNWGGGLQTQVRYSDDSDGPRIIF
ncbi:MAG: zf-HC2 domain-containing protein [Candidatus Eisenbacteria bacterium]